MIATATLLAVLVLAGCSPGEAANPTGGTPATRNAPVETRTKPTERPTTTAIPAPAPDPPARTGGICNRAKPVQRAIAEKLGLASCAQAQRELLEEIRELRIDSRTLARHDLRGLENLARLEIRGLEAPVKPGVLERLENLRELTVSIGEGRNDNPLTPGMLRGLSQLEELEVTGSGAGIRIDRELLTGAHRLKRLELSFVESLQPDSLRATPLLEEVRIHGSSATGEQPPRIPRELFAKLPMLEYVELRNFRWPPVVEVKNAATACQAKKWQSVSGSGRKGKGPLSVLVEGKYNRPKDLESLECGPR